MSAKPLEVCPECGQPKLRRLLSKPGIIFKGSGWTPKHYPGGSSSAL